VAIPLSHRAPRPTGARPEVPRRATLVDERSVLRVVAIGRGSLPSERRIVGSCGMAGRARTEAGTAYTGAIV